MPRFLSGLIGLALFTGPAFVGAAFQDERSKQDLQRLQGTWACQSVVDSGASMPAEQIKALKMTFTGDQSVDSIHPDDPATVVIDAAKTPANLDLRQKDGEIFRCIYKFENDRLIICGDFRESGRERPASFASTPKNRMIVMVLKKET